MSYYNQQQGGYPPPQGYPPNSAPGYGAPPSQSPYPTQQQGYNQQYPPPDQNYGQYPPGQYPPPGQYGQPPPPQQYGQPAYGGPPPQQNYGGYGAPPPQQYNAPPPNQYGHAPPPQPYGQQPQYGAPPPFATAQQGFPSPGYGPQSTAPINVDNEVVNLKKAFKGWGTDEKLLIQGIAKQDPIQINTIREQFNVRFQSNLLVRVDGEVKGDFKNACLEICRGPLMADCYTLRDATKGLGTKEAALNDVLMGRSNADINAIKSEFQRLFGESLESVLRGDLSAGTQQLFTMVIAARRNEETAPVAPQQTEADVAEIQRAMGTVLKDSTQVCQVLTSKSDAQLRAISQTYQQRYHKSLDKALEEKFSGHMEKALRLLVARANNRAASDAEQLEETMKGIGTRDTLLIQRLVRAHWDHRHLAQVRAEFLKIRREGLVKRLEGETSGDYRKLLIAMAQ